MPNKNKVYQRAVKFWKRPIKYNNPYRQRRSMNVCMIVQLCSNNGFWGSKASIAYGGDTTKEIFFHSNYFKFSKIVFYIQRHFLPPHGFEPGSIIFFYWKTVFMRSFAKKVATCMYTYILDITFIISSPYHLDTQAYRSLYIPTYMYV
jgi:hypothetical protein